MVDTRVLDLTEITDPAANDSLILERAAGGTVRVNPDNLVPSLGRFATLQPADVDIVNDRIRFLDATNSRPREISFEDLLFGNYGNKAEAANFTLTESLSIRAIEITNPAVTAITLDGNQANVGGGDFIIYNFLAANIQLTATNITMYVDGVSAVNASIRSRRAASIGIRNDSNEAIFSGG